VHRVQHFWLSDKKGISLQKNLCHILRSSLPELPSPLLLFSRWTWVIGQFFLGFLLSPVLEQHLSAEVAHLADAVAARRPTSYRSRMHTTASLPVIDSQLLRLWKSNARLCGLTLAMQWLLPFRKLFKFPCCHCSATDDFRIGGCVVIISYATHHHQSSVLLPSPLRQPTDPKTIAILTKTMKALFKHLSALTFVWASGRATSVKKNWVTRCWHGYLSGLWSEVQIICIWSSWCHCHPTISCITKIHIGLTFLVPAYLVCPGTRGH